MAIFAAFAACLLAFLCADSLAFFASASSFVSLALILSLYSLLFANLCSRLSSVSESSAFFVAALFLAFLLALVSLDSFFSRYSRLRTASAFVE